jgi:hypothetical protein
MVESLHPPASALHPAASAHLPIFITAPGETDVLMVVTSVILAVSVLGFGILFLRLHSLPERMAHKSHKLQFEIVAVLGLISLFTHMHIFWIAGLLLATIDLPDFGTPLNRIARSAERVAGIEPGERASEEQAQISVEAKSAEAAVEFAPETHPVAWRGGRPMPLPSTPEVGTTKPKERIHA